MSTPLEEVKRAIYSLYHGASPQELHAADTFLREFQTKSESWAACELLLCSTNFEESFFAANAISSKIAREWKTIKDGSASLQVLLLNAIQNAITNNAQQVVLSRLSCALADLTLRMVAARQIDMNTCTIFSLFSLSSVNALRSTHAARDPNVALTEVSAPDTLDLKSNSEVKMFLSFDAYGEALLPIVSSLFEWLTAMAQSFEHVSDFTSSEKQLVIEQLCLAHPYIISLLAGFISSVPNAPQVLANVKVKALACLHAWVQYGVNLSLIYADAVLSPLFSLLSTSSPRDLTLSAAETLCEIMGLPVPHTRREQVLRCMSAIVGLRPMYEQAIAGQDEDLLRPLVRLVIETADAHIQLLAENMNPPTTMGFSTAFSAVSSLSSSPAAQEGRIATECLQLVNLLLLCSSIPIRKVAELSLDIWYSLQDVLVEKWQLNIYAPAFSALADTLLTQATLPENFSSLDAEEQEEIATFRTLLEEAFRSAYFPLRLSLVEKLSARLTASGAASSWRDIEAVLFAFHSLSESLSRDLLQRPDLCSSFLSALFHVTSSGANSQVPLLRTCIQCIGDYSSWVTRSPTHITASVQTLMSCVGNLSAAEAAARSLHALSTKLCSIADDFEQEGELDGTRFARASECAQAADEAKSHLLTCLLSAVQNTAFMSAIEVNVQRLLYESLSCLIASCPSQPTQSAAMTEASTPIASALRALSTSPKSLHCAKGIAKELDKLNSLLSAFDPEQHDCGDFLLSIASSFWPLLSAIAALYQDSGDVVERLCALHKHFLILLSRCSRPPSFFDLLHATLTTTFTLFCASKSPDALDTMSVALTSLNRGEAFDRTPFVTCIQSTVSTVSSWSTQTDLSNHPDVIKSFVSLLTQIAKRNMVLLVEANVLVPLLALVQHSLFFPEREVCRASVLFLDALMNSEDPIGRDHISQLVVTHAESIIPRLIQVIFTNASSSLVPTYTDLFFTFMAKHTMATRHILDRVLSALPLACTPAQKQGFVDQLAKTRNKIMFKRNVLDFFCLVSPGHS